jgi:hypothetical protein
MAASNGRELDPGKELSLGVNTVNWKEAHLDHMAPGVYIDGFENPGDDVEFERVIGAELLNKRRDCGIQFDPEPSDRYIEYSTIMEMHRQHNIVMPEEHFIRKAEELGTQPTDYTYYAQFAHIQRLLGGQAPRRPGVRYSPEEPGCYRFNDGELAARRLLFVARHKGQGHYLVAPVTINLNDSTETRKPGGKIVTTRTVRPFRLCPGLKIFSSKDEVTEYAQRPAFYSEEYFRASFSNTGQ